MERVDIVVVGAGVVGLSVTAHVARQDRSVLLLERHDAFGQETSSRSSEVIHASIYYPRNSLKGSLCLEGNELMYALCREHGIPHKNTGKLIVAVSKEEEAKLPQLLQTARDNGAKGVRIIQRDEVKLIEPNVEARAAILCPTSGIVDSHALMQHFAAAASSRGASLVCGSEVRAIKKTKSGFVVTAKERAGGETSLETRLLINCAGLGSGEVAAMAGIDMDEAGYRIYYKKGIYFRPTRNLAKYPKMLIYPVPPSDATVGVHTTPDLGGGMRLGPHDVWTDSVEYTVDESYRGLFYEAAKPFLPFLAAEDLQPDTAGIHPKSYGPGAPSKDFVIRHEADRGLEGLIDLIGIESPGLTSSPAIGKMVARMVEEIG